MVSNRVISPSTPAQPAFPGTTPPWSCAPHSSQGACGAGRHRLPVPPHAWAVSYLGARQEPYSSTTTNPSFVTVAAAESKSIHSTPAGAQPPQQIHNLQPEWPAGLRGERGKLVPSPWPSTGAFFHKVSHAPVGSSCFVADQIMMDGGVRVSFVSVCLPTILAGCIHIL